MGSKPGKILYGEASAQVLAVHKLMFEKAGYVVVPALGRQAVENAVKLSAYELVILGHTFTKDDRHHLPYMAKKANPAVRVLVLHASGKHPAVDIAVDSRDGERVVLSAIAELMDEKRQPRPVPQAAAAVA